MDQASKNFVNEDSVAFKTKSDGERPSRLPDKNQNELRINEKQQKIGVIRREGVCLANKTVERTLNRSRSLPWTSEDYDDSRFQKYGFDNMTSDPQIASQRCQRKLMETPVN